MIMSDTYKSGRCPARVPDNNDFVACEKEAYASGLCLEHWLRHIQGIYVRLTEARARVAEESANLERALLSQQIQCKARES